MNLDLKFLSLALCVVVLLASNITNGQSVAKESGDFYEGPGVQTSEILRARGYLAEDFHFRSQDGYVIRITRGRNPLINQGRGGLPGRAPILFIHGILESFNVFVINSFEAQPSDFSNISLTSGLPDQQLNARLGDVPSAKALPLLAMDFGHEVFIMSRRGFPGSQKLTGDPISGNTDGPSGRRGPLSAFLGALTDYGNLGQQVPFSFDAKFWNFSLDEQVKYDFPRAVDFVLNQTGASQVATVGHSAGGTIILAALSQSPELNQKLCAVILWAQGFSLGHNDAFVSLTPLLPFLQTYVGSVPPAFSTDQIQAFLGLFCTTRLAQTTLCEGVADLALGKSGGQEPIGPEFINSLLYPSSSHELAQNIQCVKLGGQTHHYTNNLTRAEAYNLSAITNQKISFYTSATDSLVTAADVEATLPLLRVPYKFHLIDTTFNHNGYFYHDNTSRLVIIPSLRDIHLFSERVAL